MQFFYFFIFLGGEGVGGGKHAWSMMVILVGSHVLIFILLLPIFVNLVLILGANKVVI